MSPAERRPTSIRATLSSRPEFGPYVRPVAQADVFIRDLWTGGTDTPGTMICGPGGRRHRRDHQPPVPSSVALVGEHLQVARLALMSDSTTANTRHGRRSSPPPTSDTSAATSSTIRSITARRSARTFGPVTFIPGQGARLETQSSWIEYVMPANAPTGEFSAIFTGLP